MIRKLLLVGIVVGILQLHGIYRDFMLLYVAALSFGIALVNFAAIWSAVLFLLPFLHLGSSLFEFPKLGLIRILLLGLVIIFLLQRRGPGFWRVLFKSSGFFWFGFFVLANLISAAYVWDVEALARATTYIEPLLFYLLTYYIVNQNADNFTTVLRSIVVGGAIVGALGLIEVVSQHSVLTILNISYNPLDHPESYFFLNRFGLGGRISSTLAQPVYASLYWIIILIVFIYYCSIHKIKRIILVLLSSLGLFLILATGTRAALVTLIMTGLCFAAFSVKKVRASLAVVTVSLLFLFATSMLLPSLSSFLIETALLGEGPAAANAVGRLSLTHALLDIFQENPLFGYGPGLIQKQSLEASGIGLAGIENQYGIILADGGILAGFTYLFFMVGVLLQSWRLRKNENKEVRLAGLTLLLIFVAYFTFVITATVITPVPNLLIMAVYGAVVAQYDKRNRTI